MLILAMAKADVNMYLVGTTQVYTSTYYLLLNSVNSANLATEYTDGVTNMITVLGETMKIIYTYTPADSNNGSVPDRSQERGKLSGKRSA
jgi:hypothetical protein